MLRASFLCFGLHSGLWVACLPDMILSQLARLSDSKMGQVLDINGAGTYVASEECHRCNSLWGLGRLSLLPCSST